MTDRCNVRGKLIAAAREIRASLKGVLAFEDFSDPCHGLNLVRIGKPVRDQRGCVLRADARYAGQDGFARSVDVDEAIRVIRHDDVTFDLREFFRRHASDQIKLQQAANRGATAYTATAALTASATATAA